MFPFAIGNRKDRRKTTLYEVFGLLGEVGLFLYGMSIMSTGLRNACGEKLKTILEYSTKNKYVSVLVGIAVTMLIQSSSATDVMVIGFVNSGLMNLFQAIGVIMGANIGTTITAQITAFHISAYAPAILFVGAILHLFVAKPFIKHVGSVIMGFGMLFEGVSLMKVAISSKLVELRTPDMQSGDLQRVSRMTQTVSDIERLSDHAENIIEYAAQIRSGKGCLSPQATKELRAMCELTLESVELCLGIFETQDYTRLAEAMALEENVDQCREQLVQNHVERFMNSSCETRGGVLFCDMVTDLERCSDHAINIATALRYPC